MEDLGKRSNTLLIVIAVCGSVVGLLLAGLGVVLVYLGATGSSKINLFGNSLSSESVGVAAIFIGRVIIVAFRRVLTSHDAVLRPLPSHSKLSGQDLHEKKRRKEVEAIEGLFGAVGQASDIVSNNTYPRLINELEQYQANKMSDSVIVDNFRISLKGVIEELSQTFTDLADKGESASTDNFSK